MGLVNSEELERAKREMDFPRESRVAESVLLIVVVVVVVVVLEVEEEEEGGEVLEGEVVVVAAVVVVLVGEEESKDNGAMGATEWRSSLLARASVSPLLFFMSIFKRCHNCSSVPNLIASLSDDQQHFVTSAIHV